MSGIAPVPRRPRGAPQRPEVSQVHLVPNAARLSPSAGRVSLSHRPAASPTAGGTSREPSRSAAATSRSARSAPAGSSASVCAIELVRVLAGPLGLGLAAVAQPAADLRRVDLRVELNGEMRADAERLDAQIVARQHPRAGRRQAQVPVELQPRSFGSIRSGSSVSTVVQPISIRGARSTWPPSAAVSACAPKQMPSTGIPGGVRRPDPVQLSADPAADPLLVDRPDSAEDDHVIDAVQRRQRPALREQVHAQLSARGPRTRPRCTRRRRWRDAETTMTRIGPPSPQSGIHRPIVRERGRPRTPPPARAAGRARRASAAEIAGRCAAALPSERRRIGLTEPGRRLANECSLRPAIGEDGYGLATDRQHRPFLDAAGDHLRAEPVLHTVPLTVLERCGSAARRRSATARPSSAGTSPPTASSTAPSCRRRRTRSWWRRCRRASAPGPCSSLLGAETPRPAWTLVNLAGAGRGQPSSRAWAARDWRQRRRPRCARGCSGCGAARTARPGCRLALLGWPETGDRDLLIDWHAAFGRERRTAAGHEDAERHRDRPAQPRRPDRCGRPAASRSPWPG